MRIPSRLVRVATAAVCALSAAAAAGQAQSTGNTPVIPKNATTLEGVPDVRVDATAEGARRQVLDRADADAQSLKIEIVDGKYYWSSQGGRPLTMTSSGEFTYLSSAEPGKYVRLRRLHDRITYVEHIDMPAGSVTYWGELRIVLGK